MIYYYTERKNKSNNVYLNEKCLIMIGNQILKYFSYNISDLITHNNTCNYRIMKE